MIVRKLTTKEQLEKKRRRNYTILVIFSMLLILISPAGYVVLRGDSERKNNILEYKGIKFVRDENNYWQFQYNGMTFITKYNPKETNFTSSTGLSINYYNGEVLYFEWNESQEGYNELVKNLFYINRIPLRIVPKVCLEENCPGDLPIKSCSEDKIISFRTPVEGEKERIYTEKNCVFIVAEETDQTKYADAFLFDLLDIA